VAYIFMAVHYPHVPCDLGGPCACLVHLDVVAMTVAAGGVVTEQQPGLLIA